MDAALQVATVRDKLPWVKMTLDYTDKLAELVPAELLDWRPEDPSGKYCFSLAELLMHCADARLMFARQLDGIDSEEGYWSGEPGEDGVWQFKEHGGKQPISDSLRQARVELEKWLDQPATTLLDETAGTRQVFDKMITEFREKGRDTADFERRGPANVVRVLMAAAVHEAGHRGTLQALLRLKGLNLPEQEM